jgi:glycosyltransferase involved in cell wall biosynthesis
MSPRFGSRVVFVNHTAELGGGEIALLELLRNLDRSRIEPVVVLFAEGPLAALLRETAEVHILRLSTEVLKANKDRLGLRSLLRGSAVLAGLAFVFRLQRLLLSLRPEIVYTNSLKADLLGGVAGRLAGVPVIWHVRDRIAPEYLPRKVVGLVRLLARVVPHAIVANSAATLSTLKLDGTWSGTARARVIHDGVDPAKYTPGPIRETGGPLTVGLIGRISPWKGQDVFLQAVRLLHRAQRWPQEGVRFEIIGAATFGEVEFERRVRRMQMEAGLAEIVQFTGFEADIVQRLGRLDVVVHASTIPEPFGQVIIEGMAAGRPVIATDGGGVPEIVADGVTGILVPSRDPQALANAMAQLLGDAALRARMGDAGRAQIERRFTIRRTAEAVENMCKDVLPTSGQTLRNLETVL